jgi:WD40 repeat protein
MNGSPLLDALGASWDFGAPVVAMDWDAAGGAVGFALGDGQLAIADVAWPHGPQVERQPGGGVSMRAAQAPASRPQRVACHAGTCLSIAADPRGGFLTGGDDGQVVYASGVGAPVALAHSPGTWVDALACNRAGVRAHGGGRRVERTDRARHDSIELPAPVTALAFSPDGHGLAIAHSGGVTLWPAAGATSHLGWRGYHRALAWSPDGRYLVTAMQENALHGWRVADGGDMEMGGYPGQPLSLSFAHDGRYLATSGSTRPVCWRFDPPGAAGQPFECGLASKTPVSCVSCHPQQSLIAAGYHNGAVLLCQPGSDQVLFIKGSGGAAVNALAWSGDGRHLAFGTQGGGLGWLGLPAALFVSRAPSSPVKETMQ